MPSKNKKPPRIVRIHITERRTETTRKVRTAIRIQQGGRKR